MFIDTYQHSLNLEQVQVLVQIRAECIIVVKFSYRNFGKLQFSQKAIPNLKVA